VKRFNQTATEVVDLNHQLLGAVDKLRKFNTALCTQLRRKSELCDAQAKVSMIGK